MCKSSLRYLFGEIAARKRIKEYYGRLSCKNHFRKLQQPDVDIDHLRHLTDDIIGNQGQAIQSNG